MGQFKAIAHVQLMKQPEQIDLHGAFRDAHLYRDLLVSKALAEQPHDFTLTRSKRHAAADGHVFAGSCRQPDLHLTARHAGAAESARYFG